MKKYYAIAALLLFTHAAFAQNTATDDEDGTNVHLFPMKTNVKKKKNNFTLHFVTVDLGLNFLQDKTNYGSSTAQQFLQVPADKKNTRLFDLYALKSVNVNLWPVTARYRLLKTKHERIYLSAGIGAQFYNFRYDNGLTYTKSPNTVIYDTGHFSKNKLGVTYLSVPLMLTFKTVYGSKAYVYGVGVTGGYEIGAWTKQRSAGAGKVKQHDDFDIQKYNSCLAAELGLDGIVRFYATYQYTSLYKDALVQYPVSVGVRFMGL